MCCHSPVHHKIQCAQGQRKLVFNSSMYLTTQDHMPRYVVRYGAIPQTISPHKITCRGMLQDVLQFPLSISPHKTTCQDMLQDVLQFPCPSHHTRPYAEVCCKMCCNSPVHLTTQDHMPRYVARCVAIPPSISPHKTMCHGFPGRTSHRLACKKA